MKKSACPDRFRRALKHLYRSLWLRLSSIENIYPLLGGTWWQVLDVSPHASAEEVKRHIGDWQKTWHPDKLYAIGSKTWLGLIRLLRSLRIVAEFVVERDRSVLNCNKELTEGMGQI